MINDIKLSPSMMCINWLSVKQDLDFINSAQVFDSLHIDVTDGKFAPDFTMGTSIINMLREHTELPFDFHFMVEEPRNLLKLFLQDLEIQLSYIRNVLKTYIETLFILKTTVARSE